MAVDEDGKFVALLYAEREDKGKEVIEVRSLESDEIQASFCLKEAGAFERESQSGHLALMGDYFLLQQSWQFQVRRWRLAPNEPRSESPIVWSSPEPDPSLDDLDNIHVFFACFLAPNFLATQDDEHGVPDSVKLHRLGQTTSTHIATIDFPNIGYDQPCLSYMVAGGKIAPGQEGLVVISIETNVVSIWD